MKPQAEDRRCADVLFGESDRTHDGPVIDDVEQWWHDD
jgi:hypothetical protein